MMDAISLFFCQEQTGFAFFHRLWCASMYIPGRLELSPQLLLILLMYSHD